MLIYDHDKKFLGIDNDDLKQLGFSSAESLFEQCSDIADLFVKRPGYIHNFKNFEWIDFVLHAEAEDSKAIIHTAKNNFTCKLLIKPFYLNTAPSQSAYMVVFQNLMPLSAEEDAKIAHDIEMHPMPTPSTSIAQSIPSPSMPLPDVSLPNFDNIPATELNEPDIFDVPEEADTYPKPNIEEDLSASPFKLDVDDDMMPPLKTEPEAEVKEREFNPFAEEETQSVEPIIPTSFEADDPESLSFKTSTRSNLPDIPMLGDKLSQKDHAYIDTLTTDKDYTYNPDVAANELGLPVDLIEEFIGDFIQQSHDFHDELFEKVAAQDRETIQTLSHKLKGVAANLRIEDAFEVLSIINTSHDFEEIMANLKYFYYLVAKLEGDEEYLALENEASDQEPDEHDKEETEEEPNIYDFDAPEEDDENFDIPQKPPVFENKDVDDAIYELDIKSETQPQDDEASQEEQEEITVEEDDDLFELKQNDDEPLIIMETETEELATPQPLPDRELLDVIDTLESDPVDTDEDFKFDALSEKLDALEETSIKEALEDSNLPPPDIEIQKETEEDQETVEIQAPEEIPEEDTLHYDHVEASHELGLSEELVKNLIQDFKTDTLSHVDEISKAISSFDTTTWQRLANEYKGISDNLRLIEISNELQILIRTNDAQKAKKALRKYRNYVNQL